MRTARATQAVLTVTLTTSEVALLRRHAFPGCEAVVDSATAVTDGVELSGTVLELEDLLGWVAGEANHSREKRRKRATEAFDAIADKLDVVLGY